MAFENFWRRGREQQGGERNRGSDWRERDQGRQGAREAGGNDDDLGFDRRGWREGSDYYGSGSRDRSNEWRGSESYGSQRGYGGQEYRRDFDNRGGSDWRDEGTSYGGEFSAGSYTRGNFGLDREDDARSFGSGGYGRDLDYGRRGALGYGGYGGMGGAETGSSAYGYDATSRHGDYDATTRHGDYDATTRQSHRGRGPRGYRRSDERIREDVCELLSDDPYLDASNLEVTVKECEITLSGTVTSREDKRRAESLAERVSGVKDVHNSLRVASEARGQDATQGSMQNPAGQDPARQTSRH